MSVNLKAGLDVNQNTVVKCVLKRTRPKKKKKNKG